MIPSQFHTWAVERALPLWSENGFDKRRSLFHERLDFEGNPLEMPALRLMVQARQIATYSRAALRGDHGTGEKALRCLTEVERHYHRTDGAPGWIFSLGPDGQPADRRRDLYAHAFILFAYAWAYRLSGDTRIRTRAWDASVELRAIFHSPLDGFLDAQPAYDTVRRQNPHMHLLEAYLALFETTGDEAYRDFAGEMVTLGLNRFIEPKTFLLLEDFDADWRPLKPFGHNHAEPGHLFEWSWLLQEYLRLYPAAPDAGQIRIVADSLHKTALIHTTGTVLPIIKDSVSETGAIIGPNTRIWPQTEFMRSLALSMPEEEWATSNLMTAVLENFSINYIPSHLNGGWIDRLDTHGHSIIDHMPASSLYHIYGAICELNPRKRL